jgi:hypothetical protein
MIDSLNTESLSLNFYKNSYDPDLAIVPKLSDISSLVIPTPESNRVIVLSFGLVVIFIYRPPAC